MKTNSDGYASLNTNGLAKGTHKVELSSANNKYSLNGTSKIIIN